MKIITIIPNPTWGKTLELFQEKKSIRLLSSDADNFKKLLDSVNFKYTTEEDLEKKYSRFILSETVA